jgi:hypothetical protein
MIRLMDGVEAVEGVATSKFWRPTSSARWFSEATGHRLTWGTWTLANNEVANHTRTRENSILTYPASWEV